MERTEEMEREYDRLLRERVAEVRDYVEAQRDALGRHGIDTASFHLPLRPFLFSPPRLQHLQRCVEAFWSGLLKVFFVEFGGDLRRIARLLQLPEPVVDCLERYFAPERELSQLFGRPDGFAWGANVKFIEQNITSGPGGLASTDALCRFFDGFPVIRALRERGPVTRLSPMDSYVSLFSSPRFAGKSIGYVDAIDPKTGGLWDDDGLRFLAILEEQGVHLINLTLTGRAIELRDDGVYVEGRRLDYLYRGVAAIALWFRMEELAPLFQACGRKQAEMIISPFEMVFFDKMLLPYLSDERLSPFLSAGERRLLSEIIPWSRFLRDEETTYRGKPLRIPTLCLEKKDALVIKKGNGFGSDAVFMGSECTESDWRGHVERGLNEGNWIVQEIVAPPSTPLPYLERGELVWADAMSMACPFIVAGKVSGVAGRTTVPGGGRILVGAGREGSKAGIRTAFHLG